MSTKPSKTYHPAWLIVWFMVGLFALYVALGYLTRTSTPWGPPEVSPDGRFEIISLQVSDVFPSFRLSFPGQGSDNVNGYLVLRDRRTGQELHRAYRTGLKFYETHWDDHSVYFLGSDGFAWPLPK